MTNRPDPQERSRLFVTDEQLIHKLGIPANTARAAIQALDQAPRSGFPRKQALFGNRRYLPACLDWFAAHATGEAPFGRLVPIEGRQRHG